MLRLLAVVMVLFLTACGADRGPPPPTEAERAERMADAGLQRVEAARSGGRQEAALIYAEEILTHFPATAAGRKLQAEIDGMRTAAAQEREARRLLDLWTYHAVEDAGGVVHTAYIFGQTEQAGAPAVRLVLRRHPEWGQSTYLLIGGGDFACQGTCKVATTIDDGQVQSFVISRAKDVDPPAVFLDEDTKVMAALDGAKRITMSIPLENGESPDYLFEVEGFALTRLGPPAAAASP